MRKTSSNTWLSFVVALVCAISISAVLSKSGPSVTIAVLSIVITTLSIQLILLRRDLSNLKDHLVRGDKT